MLRKNKSHSVPDSKNVETTAALTLIQSKFESLAQRHKSELSSKPAWVAPHVSRRTRAMVLSGYLGLPPKFLFNRERTRYTYLIFLARKFVFLREHINFYKNSSNLD